MTDASTAALLLHRLAAAPAQLEALVNSRPVAALQARPASGDWSAWEIIVHLRASSDLITPRFYQVLVREGTPLPAYDERRWAEVAGLASLTPATLVAGFASRRADLLHMLHRLTPADWQRSGQHDVHGPVTLAQLAGHLADHEAEHLAHLISLPPVHPAGGEVQAASSLPGREQP